MKFDITSIQDGLDLGVGMSEAPRAGNVIQVQLGSLEYAPTFGVDLTYFIASEYRFQNASFKAYLVERLLQHQINVVNILESVEALFSTFKFEIGATDTGGSLIA